MPRQKKLTSCPHCQSDKGFYLTTYLGGYQEDFYNFQGKLIDSNRCGADKTEEKGVCLNCNKSFDIERVKIISK